MKKCFITCLALFLMIVHVTGQNIYTLAGDGGSYYSGDGGAATAAQLSTSIFVKGDPSGNIYIADRGNYRIRKIDATTGVITTIAGTGVDGYSGDGGLATDAKINCAALCADADGNVYFTDSNCIRKIIASTHKVQTIAGTGVAGYSGDGGDAASATLHQPLGLVIDDTGNLYFSDALNNVIRKISAATNIISTIAGNGYLAGIGGGYSGDGGPATEAELYAPYGLCLDSVGNIYFADAENYRVRRVDKTTGIITTVAGMGAATEESGDGGPATEAFLESAVDVSFGPGGILYIAQDVHSIRAVSPGGIITTIAGNAGQGYNGDSIHATAAELFYPQSVFVDATGSIFIGDAGNMRVRKVSDLVISTVAGNGFAFFSGDGGPCNAAELSEPGCIYADPMGNIYFSDGSNCRIRKIDVHDTITTVAGNGTFSFSGDGGLAKYAAISTPSGIAADGAGNIYFADEDNCRVRKIEIGSGIITTIAGNGATTISGDGGPAALAGLSYINAMCMDAVGNIYVASYARIRKIDAVSGIISTVAGGATSGYTGDGGLAIHATLGSISGICSDVSGNIYISDQDHNVVRKIDAETGDISTVAGDGYVGYVEEMSFYTYLGGYTGDGGLATEAELDYPTGICVTPAGTLFIADKNNNVIRKVTTDGVISTFAGNGYGAVSYTSGGETYSYSSGFSGDGGPATNAELAMPVAVCLNGESELLISDGINRRIRKVTGDLAVPGIARNNGISVFPNPACNIITVAIGTGVNGESISVYNILGKEIYQTQSVKNTNEIDISHIPSGTYLVMVKTNNDNFIQKVVVQH